MERKKVLVTLKGCDDSTNMEVEVTDSELQFLYRLSKQIEGTSTYDCMPTLVIMEEYTAEDAENS